MSTAGENFLNLLASATISCSTHAVLPVFVYYEDMFGTIDVKVRPIKLGFLVDPNDAQQVRHAIQIASSLWGGAFFPIIPVHKRMPKTWKESPLEAPASKDVVLGYVDAFDPDILVQFCATMPGYLSESRLKIIKPELIWEPLSKQGHISPQFGVGIFELLNDVFDEHFKYNAKYPIKVVIPKVPDVFSLFWTSVFGEISMDLERLIESNYFEPLDATFVDFQPDKLRQMLERNILFPRRITQRRLKHFNRSGGLPLMQSSIFSTHRELRISSIFGTYVRSAKKYFQYPDSLSIMRN